MFNRVSFVSVSGVLLFSLLGAIGCSSSNQQTVAIKLTDFEDIQAMVNRIIALQNQYGVFLADDTKAVRVYCTPYDADKHSGIKLVSIAVPLVSMPQTPVRSINASLPTLFLSSRETSLDGVLVTRQQLSSIIEAKLQKEKGGEELVIVLAHDVPMTNFQSVWESLAKMDNLEGILLVGSK